MTLEDWIAPRVLKLSCTADDMKPLAKACGMKPMVHKWKTAERDELMAELDAAYFTLYGIDREDMIFMLSTFQGTRKGPDIIFDPDPSVALSGSGQAIVEEYDALSGK